MKLFAIPSHVDRLNLVAPPYESGSGTIAGPYRVDAVALYLPGADESQIYHPGAARSQVYLTGAQAAQVAAGRTVAG